MAVRRIVKEGAVRSRAMIDQRPSEIDSTILSHSNIFAMRSVKFRNRACHCVVMAIEDSSMLPILKTEKRIIVEMQSYL